MMKKLEKAERIVTLIDKKRALEKSFKYMRESPDTPQLGVKVTQYPNCYSEEINYIGGFSGEKLRIILFEFNNWYKDSSPTYLKDKIELEAKRASLLESIATIDESIDKLLT